MKNLTQIVEQARRESDGPLYHGYGQVELLEAKVEKIFDVLEAIAAELDSMHGTVKDKEWFVVVDGEIVYMAKGANAEDRAREVVRDFQTSYNSPIDARAFSNREEAEAAAWRE